MTRLTLLCITALILISTNLLGCAHHHKKHRRGIANANTSSVTEVSTSSTVQVDSSSIDGTTLTFYDGLSDADKLWLIEQIRNEIIAWEVANGGRLQDIIIDVLVTNNIDNSVVLELADETIYVGCQDEVGPHNLPPGILKKLLCTTQGHESPSCVCDEEEHEEDDD